MNYQSQSQQYQEGLKKIISLIKQQVLTPDILQFDKELYVLIYKTVKQQQQRIKNLQEDDQQVDISKHDRNLKQQIYRCQTQKVGYLLKEYLRVRLRKIEKYCFYLCKNDAQARKKLSDNEYTFMKSYATMKFSYFEEVVLKHLAKAYRGFGGLQIFLSKPGQYKNQIKNQIQTKQSKVQIPQPSNDTYVFCHLSGNPDLYRFNSDIPTANVEDKSVIPTGSILYTQWKYVSKLVSQGNGELI